MTLEPVNAPTAITVGGETFRSERELLDIAPARIAELDARARHAAKEAVSCAVAAGRLLLSVRDRLPHGAFLAWCATECPSVPHRTATRYMALASAMLADGAEGQTAIAERPLSQLYQDYGIVRHNPKHGGAREGAGRPAKDAAEDVASAASDPDLNWAEVSGYLKGIFDFGEAGDGWGTLADDDLESALVTLRAAASRVETLLKSRREGATL